MVGRKLLRLRGSENRIGASGTPVTILWTSLGSSQAVARERQTSGDVNMHTNHERPWYRWYVLFILT